MIKPGVVQCECRYDVMHGKLVLIVASEEGLVFPSQFELQSVVARVEIDAQIPPSTQDMYRFVNRMTYLIEVRSEKRILFECLYNVVSANPRYQG